MARTTISIPDALKEEMDAVSERVNWSAVAADAFRVKLGELAAKKQNHMTTSEVKARLRASRIKSQSEDYSLGHEAGRRWATEDAEWNELHALSLHTPVWDDIADPAHWFIDAAGMGEEVWDLGEFWTSVYDTECPSREDVRGFFDGALAVLREVGDLS